MALKQNRAKNTNSTFTTLIFVELIFRIDPKITILNSVELNRKILVSMYILKNTIFNKQLHDLLEKKMCKMTHFIKIYLKNLIVLRSCNKFCQ